MSFNIAVAGKGGSGKTTIAGLIIRYLSRNGKGPILAVDADPNANLGESLGLEIGQTIGSIIASFNEEKIKIPQGMTKEAYLDFKLNRAVVESKGLDLVTMGRGEGPECYCYPNLLLRKFIDTLSQNYTYVVMDNEAGMEHLSRRTTQNIDVLMVVSDHSVKGVRTIARIRDIVSELKLVVKRQLVIINFVPDTLNSTVKEELARLNVNLDTVVPFDEQVQRCDLEMKSLFSLSDTSNAVTTVNNIMNEILTS